MVLAVRELGFKPFFCYLRTDLFTPQTDFRELYDWWKGDMVHFRTGWEPGEGVLALSKGMYAFSKFKNLVDSWRRLLPSPFAEWLLSMPAGDGWYPPALSEWVSRFCGEHKPVACIVEYAFLSKALLYVPAGTHRIIDAHDMLSQRNPRLKAAGLLWCNISLTRSQEKRMLARAEKVIAIQRDEEAAFRALLPASVEVCSVDILSQPRNVFRREPHAPAVVGYIGAVSPLNLRGIEWFLENCWPDVRVRIPGAVFRVAGTICKEVKAGPGIELLGSTEELEAFYGGCRCMINPCLAGSGLKIKCIEALQMGVPLVTTSAGAEGLGDGAGTAYELADSAEDFAARVAAFLSDPDLGARTSASALEYAAGRRRASLLKLEHALGCVSESAPALRI
jgi:glycosyltransferase involved in cell wall biosynthesis